MFEAYGFDDIAVEESVETRIVIVCAIEQAPLFAIYVSTCCDNMIWWPTTITKLIPLSAATSHNKGMRQIE